MVVLVCAISAGIHAALAPDHFREAVATGIGFAGSAVALALVAGVLARDPGHRAALAAAAALLAGLLLAYVLAVTTGVPVLLPEPEAVDGVALVTKAIELAGLLAALSLLWRPHPSGGHPPRPVPLAVAAIVALFSAFVALELSGGHGGHAHVGHDHAARAERGT